MKRFCVSVLVLSVLVGGCSTGKFHVGWGGEELPGGSKTPPGITLEVGVVYDHLETLNTLRRVRDVVFKLFTP